MKRDTQRRRCAIYTRKSSEEGLDQSFNSLDAQREACGAYILSQAHEGWEPIDEIYDDGGYSGGSMERPALKQLMADVEAGKIDIIVVYKVDRLTRSLADFARIVDVLDRQGASFVSVTQAFNTTNSMGRLTLNVLLSFAQFEREVTGERIRDKIAASKARGMWMGGVVPLGYEVRDRKLHIVPDEAERIRYIFSRYLELGSVLMLQADLATNGVRTKTRTRKDGRAGGDKNFSRGGLYEILRNRLYLGEVTHRGKSYPGEHDAIVDVDVFEKVGSLLDENRIDQKHSAHAEHPSLLAGIIWDGYGRRLIPTHANKKNVRYRYYASRKEKDRLELPVARIPAGNIESFVVHQMRRHTKASWEGEFPAREQILNLIERISVYADRIEILFSGRSEAISIAAAFISRSGETRIAVDPENYLAPRRDVALIKLIARAHQAVKALGNSANATIYDAADALGISTQYFRTLLRFAYLAPDITAAILDGRQPAHFNRQFLARFTSLPMEWASQREVLGFNGILLPTTESSS